MNIWYVKVTPFNVKCIHLNYLYLQRHFNNIIYNLMDVCSHKDMQHLLLNIEGPAVQILKSIYGEYRAIIRFTGRL